VKIVRLSGDRPDRERPDVFDFLMKGQREKPLPSHCRNLASIISARRMLSAILETTAGDDLISSRLSRTAAINEAAIRMALFIFFVSSLLLPVLPALRSRQLLLGLGQGLPLKTSTAL
jgi:hypothetical protein